MIENLKRVDNPLTIIGFFAVIAEITMTVAFSAVSLELRPVFIWFVMAFPPFLVILFFLTLNFNHKVLYAPSDFRDDANFMELAAASGATKSLNEAEKQLENIRHQIDKVSEPSDSSPASKEALQGAINDIAQNISDAKKRVKGLFYDLETYPEMSWGQWRVLAYLYHQPNAVSVDSLSAGLDISRAVALYDLATLQSYGLVKSKEEAGQRLMELTEGGRVWTSKEVDSFTSFFRQGISVGANEQKKS
jgi:hypothetical protein